MTSAGSLKPGDPNGIGASITVETTVEQKNTVGFIVPGMPEVAATPFLVSVAEKACYRIAEKLIDPGQITVGARVVIDHLGASKVGAVLVTHATLRERVKNRFIFDVTIKDGDRVVANVEHVRAAVSLQKLMSALG